MVVPINSSGKGAVVKLYSAYLAWLPENAALARQHIHAIKSL
jgi:hypothetical protein